MGLLKPATNKMAFAKVGLYGGAGAGKTRTAAEFAIGLHKAIGSKKPIAGFDTEPAFSFILPLFKKAGIELLISDESRSLKDLMQFMDEAEKVSDIVIIDSITHVWRDAQESYLAKVNEGRTRYGKKPLTALEFQHWRPIKAAWAEFTDRFLSSKMHVIVCGRAGQVYEYQDKDDGSGKKELITTGTRMATEKELGYEPSLLIELVAEREEGKIINTAYVQKDRADMLNGAVIQMPNYDKFKKHFDFLNIGGEHFGPMNQSDSKDLYTEEGDDNWGHEKRQREIWNEEIANLLAKAGLAGTAKDVQLNRIAVLEEVFGTASKTKMESTSSDKLKAGYEILKAKLLPETSSSEPVINITEDVPQ